MIAIPWDLTTPECHKCLLQEKEREYGVGKEGMNNPNWRLWERCLGKVVTEMAPGSFRKRDLSTLRLPSWTQSRFSPEPRKQGSVPCLVTFCWNHLAFSFTFLNPGHLEDATGTALLCGGCIILCACSSLLIPVHYFYFAYLSSKLKRFSQNLSL